MVAPIFFLASSMNPSSRFNSPVLPPKKLPLIDICPRIYRVAPQWESHNTTQAQRTVHALTPAVMDLMRLHILPSSWLTDAENISLIELSNWKWRFLKKLNYEHILISVMDFQIEIPKQRRSS